MTRHLKLSKWLSSIQFFDIAFLQIKEQLSLANSRITETEQLSIEGVIKLYFSCNLVPCFDLFIKRRTYLCLYLHRHPLFGYIYIRVEFI